MSETSDRYARFGFEAQRRSASAGEASLKEGFALLAQGWLALADQGATLRPNPAAEGARLTIGKGERLSVIHGTWRVEADVAFCQLVRNFALAFSSVGPRALETIPCFGSTYT